MWLAIWVRTGELWAKPYGIKLRCYSKCVEEQLENLGNTMGTWWEYIGNKGNFFWTPCDYMLSFLICEYITYGYYHIRACTCGLTPWKTTMGILENGRCSSFQIPVGFLHSISAYANNTLQKKWACENNGQFSHLEKYFLQSHCPLLGQ